MSSEEDKVSSYDEFREKVLPLVDNLRNSAIQLMAVMEHAYHGSFGYHVTSFFPCASRGGSAESLKRLIDACHLAGLIALMDVVHTYCSDNAADGVAYLDG
jgi:1,4-alpha-glucan branching enzyme